MSLDNQNHALFAMTDPLIMSLVSLYNAIFERTSLNIKSPIQRLEYLPAPSFTLQLFVLFTCKKVSHLIEKYRFHVGTHVTILCFFYSSLFLKLLLHVHVVVMFFLIPVYYAI